VTSYCSIAHADMSVVLAAKQKHSWGGGSTGLSLLAVI
jgi:hypothetical protein